MKNICENCVTLQSSKFQLLQGNVVLESHVMFSQLREFLDQVHNFAAWFSMISAGCWTQVPKWQSQQDPNYMTHLPSFQQTQPIVRPLAIVTWYANHSSIDMYLINFRNHDVPYLCCHLGPISFDTCRHLGPFNCTSSLAFVACSAASFFSAVQRSSAWKLHRRNVVQTETRLKFYTNVPRSPAVLSLRLNRQQQNTR